MQHTEKWISAVHDAQTDQMKQDKFVQICTEALRKRGIDISDDGYYRNKKFKDLEKEYMTGKVFIPLTWWIEKNLVGQERLKKIYGIYAMGIEHEFSEKELENSSWMECLLNKYQDTKRKTEGEFGRTKKDIEQYSSRLIKRLKKAGFNIDEFEPSETKKEKVKLLYFLYCFEFDNKVKIGPFLSNPTLENVDNICAGDKTRNGELMACLKNNLLKEISLEYAQKVKKCLYDIPTQIEEQIFYIRYTETEENNLEKMEKFIHDLEWLLSKVKEENAGKYQDSLLETFYLKLSLHEMIGREIDLLDVSDRYSDGKYEPSEFLINKYSELLNLEPLKVNWGNKSKRDKLIEKYFNKHRKILAQYVFGKKSINSNEYRKYDRAINGFKNYLDFMSSNTKACLEEYMGAHYIISFLQEFIFMDKNEKVENKFYRYISDDKKTLNSEIFNGQQSFRKNQLAWHEKVNYRYYANAGMLEIFKKEKEAEKAMDSILLEIYRCNSLRELNFTSGLILSYIKTFGKNNHIVSGYYNRLEELMQQKQYDFYVKGEKEFFRAFLGSLEKDGFNFLYVFLADKIDEAESKGKEIDFHFRNIVNIESYTGHLLNVFLEFEICPEEREVIFRTG